MRVRGAAFRVLGILGIALLVSAHVGSPDVFFSGKAGPYDIKVVVRPPQVVPGIAQVFVTAPAGISGVSIRPVFWRAGSKGAPSPDAMRQVEGTMTFSGSLWLMARGAYTVDVIVDGPGGVGNVLVPVASVATGRLGLSRGFGAVLVVIGLFLVAGLVTIVYKAAGESLVEPGRSPAPASVHTARIAGGVAFAVIALLIFGGSRWWSALDTQYQESMYEPAKLPASIRNGVLHVEPTGRFVPDHGKLMHLFMVRASDMRVFAHLHPEPVDTALVPALAAPLPPLPVGRYHVFADVVQQTGFERTLVASLDVVADSSPPARSALASRTKADPDDAWFVGDASADGKARLADGSIMSLTFDPAMLVADSGVTLGVGVTDASGRPATLEPYMGMPAHAVVVRLDGAVYVHLHTMGTVTQAAQDAFRARDRGDTTTQGALRIEDHSAHTMAAMAAAPVQGVIEFPYAFPKSGDYRVFVQVKRNGRVLTGAFAVTVADSSGPSR
jgi:hypothetical protein